MVAFGWPACRPSGFILVDSLDENIRGGAPLSPIDPLAREELVLPGNKDGANRFPTGLCDFDGETELPTVTSTERWPES